MTDLLHDGDLEIRGGIMPASNQTFLGTLRLGEESADCVYKPRSGERPLWDFPDGTLALREYAAAVVSEALGWQIVPPTVLREGPRGAGMVQLWREPVVGDLDPVEIVPSGKVPPGYLHVLDAVDQHEQPVSLVHEDTPALRRMAVFDALVNNTDRKGGHVLPMADGHRFGVDHGVCFHTDDKLRTVLWGWAGCELTADERAGCETVLHLDGELDELLSGQEIEALHARARRLLRDGLPVPAGGWPSIPWPPF